MTTPGLPSAAPALDAFEAAPAHPTIDERRRIGLDRWNAVGFPTRREEAWRYCDLRGLADRGFTPAPEATIARAEMEAYHVPGCDCFVFVNGRHAQALSSVQALPTGARLMSLAEAIRDDYPAALEHLARYADVETSPFTALNTALLADGAVLALDENVALERPLQLLFVSTGGDDVPATHPRNLVVAAAGTKATIIETYAGIGTGPRFTNAVTEIVATGTAEIDHYKVNRETTETWHVGTFQLYETGDGHVTSTCASFGGRLVRNEFNCVLDEEGSFCTLNGLTLAAGEQHVDNHLRVDHARPSCKSWEFFKGIYDDRSSGSFCGRIYVAQDAQKTDAKQTNMSLLLSDDAQVTTRPQLEIFADDVKCTHGATVGALDPAQLFYLRSRGIGAEAARSLLVFAFANEVLEEVRVAALRDQLEGLILDRLPAGALLRGGA